MLVLSLSPISHTSVLCTLTCYLVILSISLRSICPRPSRGNPVALNLQWLFEYITDTIINTSCLFYVRRHKQINSKCLALLFATKQGQKHNVISCLLQIIIQLLCAFMFIMLPASERSYILLLRGEALTEILVHLHFFYKKRKSIAQQYATIYSILQNRHSVR